MTMPTQHRLLFDEGDIAASRNVRRVLHRPTPYPGNPLRLGADYIDRRKLADRRVSNPDADQHALNASPPAAGEDPLFKPAVFGRFGYPMSVVQRPGGPLQMYYQVSGGLSPAANVSHDGAWTSCYAESHNGVHWELPSLRRVELLGSRENNALFPPNSMAHVTIDEHAQDPARRYVAFIHPGPRIAFSPDGLTWSEPQKARVETRLGRSDGDTFYGWDERHGKYVAFLRPWREHPDDADYKPFHRRIARAVSDDLLLWRDHRLVLGADYAAGDEEDLERMQVFRYGDRYLGLLHVLRYYPEERRHVSFINGPVYVELTYSRDGVAWQRFDERDAFLACQNGVRDVGCLFAANRPALFGSQLHFYYGFTTETHGKLPSDMRPGLARLTEDRFVGWRAEGLEQGTVQTVPFDCPGGRLRVNADVRGGSMQVAVILADGAHDMERAAMRCIDLGGDEIAHTPRWQRVASLDDLRGQPISLKFYLRNAEVFSYWFEETSTPVGR